MNWRCRESGANDFLKLLRIVGSAAAGTAQCERWSDDGRIASASNNLSRFIPGSREATLRHLEPFFVHRPLEEQTVFRNRNGLPIRADHFHSTFVEHAAISQRHRQVERRLASYSWQ